MGVVLVLALLVVALLIGVFVRRSGDSGQVVGDGEAGPIVIGVPNWESAMGTAYILRELLEENFAVETALYSGTNEELYTGIADGSIHIHPEGWSPNHDDWHARYADVLERNRSSIVATQGMCIDRMLATQYNLQHIDDLLNPGIAQYFDSDGDGRGEIWIGDEGWGSTTVERVRARSYGYDTAYELVEMPESEALQRFEDATAAGKLFAFYCYTPHWMWQTYKLYELKEPRHNPSKWRVVFPSEDPQWLEKSNAAMAWEPAKLHVYYAKALEKQYPYVARFLKKVRFTPDELQQITHDLKTSGLDPATYAQQWVAENR